MQSLKEQSYRTKRRKIAAGVTKLLSELNCATETNVEFVANSLPAETFLSCHIEKDLAVPDLHCKHECHAETNNNHNSMNCTTHSSTDAEICSCGDTDEVCEDSRDVPLPLDFPEEHTALSLECNFYIDDDIPVESSDWTPGAVNDSGDEGTESNAFGIVLSAQDKLAQWALTYNISHAALSALLCTLQTCHASEVINLPKDARTLLSAERHIDIDHKAGGDYYYFGIQYWLGVLFKRYPQAFNNINSHIKLLINVDGIPLFNSSSVALWPILGAVLNVDSCPFPIAVFCSKTKPTSVDDYFKDFISEMQCLETVGFHYEGRHFTVCLHAVICDAPARAFLKCIKSHSGYDSCERCCQHGEWNGKVTFPELCAQTRTDLNFRLKVFPDHHLIAISSPLLQLNFGLVSGFPLDYMHLVCLGVMRRLLWLWIHGPRSTKLSQSQLTLVSDKLLNLQPHIPREFARKPRSLSEYKMWKATELRQFLLYSGPVVLKGVLPTNLYEHFLALSVAIRILLTDELLKFYVQYAQDLLKYFVSSFGIMYGRDHLVYNVHSLIHIADDAKKYGALDSVSAFQFECYLGRLKKLVRRPQQPCTQIVRRLLEGHCQPIVCNIEDTVRFKGPHMEGPLPVTHVQFSQFKQYFRQCHINFMSVSTGDNCFEVCGKLGIVRNILKEGKDEEHNGYIVFEEFISQNSFFNQPLNSQSLSIFYVEKLSCVHTVFSLSNSMRKYVLLPFKAGYVALPQMHKS